MVCAPNHPNFGVYRTIHTERGLRGSSGDDADPSAPRAGQMLQNAEAETGESVTVPSMAPNLFREVEPGRV